MSYKGKITTVGSSEAIRLEKDLFRQHPEFKQSAIVKADIIGRGRILISVVSKSNTKEDEDPVVGAFLSFLERDMSENAAAITAVDAKSIARAKTVTKGVTVKDD